MSYIQNNNKEKSDRKTNKEKIWQTISISCNLFKKKNMDKLREIVLFFVIIWISMQKIYCSDITPQAFGSINDTIISAFGDFNSDELTDIFIRSTDGKRLEIMLASDVEPLLRRSKYTRCDFKQLNITSIVPGDFDGDAYMDLLITCKSNTNSSLLDVYINWGGLDTLNCTDENSEPLFRMIGEPVALDYNRDMIIDLFGLNENGSRTFWVFKERFETPKAIPMDLPEENMPELSIPHSNAYLDLNDDFKADLFLETKLGFEVWHGTEHDGFNFSHRIPLPTKISNQIHGQSIFLDIELNGSIAQVLPMCYDPLCKNSAILAYVNGQYHDLQIDFNDDKHQGWQFIVPDRNQRQIYQNSITLRGGDFNLDGFPDLLVTLKSSTTNNIETFLMENVPCATCDPLKRSFAIRWKAFSPYANGTVVGAFYDFLQVS